MHNATFTPPKHHNETTSFRKTPSKITNPPQDKKMLLKREKAARQIAEPPILLNPTYTAA
jgi:hypothetical protein